MSLLTQKCSTLILSKVFGKAFPQVSVLLANVTICFGSVASSSPRTGSFWFFIDCQSPRFQRFANVALAPWRWTKRCIEIRSRPVDLALRPGEPPWVLQYSQLASCQSGSITVRSQLQGRNGGRNHRSAPGLFVHSGSRAPTATRILAPKDHTLRSAAPGTTRPRTEPGQPRYSD
jgi:hypothetical protein